MKKLLALLLAVAMLATLCACGKKDKDDKGVANKPEDVAEAFVKAEALEDYASQFDLTAFDYEAMLKDRALSGYDSEEELFEEISEEYDEDITSWKKLFSASLKEAKESLKEVYGDDYKIKVKATDTEELDEDGIAEVIDFLKDEASGYIDEDALEDIDEAVDVTVEVSISGEEDETTYTMVVTIVKIDGKWKVADYSYSSSDDDYYGDYEDNYNTEYGDYEDYYGDYEYPSYEDEY